MKRPKTNPRRTPLPAAVREAQARDRAVEGLSDSVAKGYVNVRDLMEALDQEAGILLR